MTGREKSESGQVEGFRVPDRDLPDLSLWIRIGPRRRSGGRDGVLDVAHWRVRGCRRAVDTYALSRGRVRGNIDGLLEEAVVPLAEESVESIEAAEDCESVYKECCLD